MGDLVGRIGTPHIAARLAALVAAMLRTLDFGRQILRFPAPEPFPWKLSSRKPLWTLDERRGLLRRVPPEPVQLTSGPIRWNTPIPSKDGTKIFAQGVIQRGELVRFDAQSHRLEPWLGGISAEFVSFSPDGQFVAYVTFPEGVLWRANRDGSNPVQLTDPPMNPIIPRWSPDGTQILFHSEVRTGTPEATSSLPRAVVYRGCFSRKRKGKAMRTGPPTDARSFFLLLQSVEAIGSLNYVLRVLDLGSHQITTLPVRKEPFRLDGRPTAASSPGTHIGAPGGLKVFDFETQRWSLLPEKGECHYPTWSSNSQFIYFLRRGANRECFESAFQTASRSALSI